MRRSDLRDLKRFELLADFDDEDRRALSESLEVRELEAGESVFARGDSSDALVLIAEGCVRVRLAGCEAPGHLTDGASLGTLSPVCEGPREVDAEAASRTRLFVLRRERFAGLVDAEPRVACHLLQAILRDQARLLREAAGVIGPPPAPTP